MKEFIGCEDRIVREFKIVNDSNKPNFMVVQITITVPEWSRNLILDVVVYPDKHFVHGVRMFDWKNKTLTWNQEFLDRQVSLAIQEFKSQYCQQCQNPQEQ